jgi:hypothetical protein
MGDRAIATMPFFAHIEVCENCLSKYDFRVHLVFCKGEAFRQTIY